MRSNFAARALSYVLVGSLVTGTVCQGGAVKAADSGESVVKKWDFEDGIGKWVNAGWNWEYDGEEATVAAEYGMLKVNVDYSKGADTSWSQIGIGEWGSVDLLDVAKTTFDLYYQPEQLSKGGFSVKEVLQYQNGSDYPSAVEETVSVDTGAAVDADVTGLSGWKKTKVTVKFEPVSKDICNVVLCLVGQNTTYKGALYIDNLEMVKAGATEDIYVDAKTTVVPQKALSIENQTLHSFDKNGADTSVELVKGVKLADGKADAGTAAVYTYLKAMGESDSVIFGHQNDTWHKAGSKELSDSDTRDVVGSISGIVGMDALSLTGNEYSAKRYNEEMGDTEKLPETAKGNVMAAAKLANKNIAEGGILTLSAHMPNFSVVKEAAGYQAGSDPTYAKYEFSGYTPNTIAGDVMNEILPGGKYHEVYTAYLDMIADFALQVNGTVLFRPFHENTGSWFWWGKAFCSASTYKNVYKYTVEYLRDIKNVHNMLYVYGPGSEAASVEEYGERYPGDRYVDMVGFDMYHSAPKEKDTWFDSFAAELKIVEDFAKAHDKLVAVTETGVANSADRGDNQTALHKTGNEQKDWYDKMLEAVSKTNASYFLVWANFGEKDGFYTPYVKSVNPDGVLHGHEMLDYFTDFYNDPRSVFAAEQKDVLTALKDKLTVEKMGVSEGVYGFITSPVGGRRILDAASLTARLSGTGDVSKVSFLCKNGAKTVELSAQVLEKEASAALTKEDLKSLGEGVGTISLKISSETVDEVSVIFNIPEPTKDPYEIDGFENYFGEAALLQKDWAVNKDSGCTIDIGLSKEKDTVYDGEYSLKFDYTEKVGGWAGTTIGKEVDWSSCNALKLWTIPDGKNQKVVIQITADGKEYEAYLNTYDEYKDKVTPLLVTIPFSEFKDRDGDGPAGGLVELSGKIQSFGLWVNQVGDSEVSGTIYYDKITAVKSDVKKTTFETEKDQTVVSAKKKGKITGVKTSYKKKTGDKAFNLKAKGTGKLTFVSSDNKVVKVGKKNGKVTIKGAGKAVITITSAENASYKKAVKKVKITVTKKKKKK